MTKKRLDLDEVYIRKEGLQSEFNRTMQMVQKVGQEQQIRLNRANEIRGAIQELDRLLDGFIPEPAVPTPTPIPPVEEPSTAELKSQKKDK